MKTLGWRLLLVTLLVVTNAAWVFATLSRGLASTQQADELGRRERMAHMLYLLLVELPRDANQQAAYRFLLSRFPGEVIKLEGDTVEIGDLALVYSEGRLVQVAPF